MREDHRAEVNQALKVVSEGGILLYPTDTGWSLGCDATNPKAIARIAELKQQPLPTSTTLLVANDALLNHHVEEVPALAWDLIDLADKPTTIIYPQGKNLPAALMPENGSIGIRMVQDPFCRDLILRLRKPLVSTSVHLKDQPRPKTFVDIDPLFLDAVDYVVNLRQNEAQRAQTSSIIQLDLNGEIVIIRK